MIRRLVFHPSSIACATLMWLASGDAATPQRLMVVPAQEERSGARIAPPAPGRPSAAGAWPRLLKRAT